MFEISSNEPSDLKALDESDSEFEGFKDASTRLVLVLTPFRQAVFTRGTGEFTQIDRWPEGWANLHAAGNGRTEVALPLLADLARYIFSFPSRCTPPFIRLVQRNDPGALLILFFYYHAVLLLLPERRCWWSRRRAESLVPALERVLREKGGDQMATTLDEGKMILQGLNRHVGLGKSAHGHLAVEEKKVMCHNRVCRQK